MNHLQVLTGGLAPGGDKSVSVSPQEMMLILELDLASHMLMGAANQVAGVLKLPEAATHFHVCIGLLQEYKNKVVAKAGQRIVLASAADIPPIPPTP